MPNEIYSLESIHAALKTGFTNISRGAFTLRKISPITLIRRGIEPTFLCITTGKYRTPFIQSCLQMVINNFILNENKQCHQILVYRYSHLQQYYEFDVSVLDS